MNERKYSIVGISWAVGGDYTYSQIPTVPNALRQYKTNLNGYSTKGSLLSTREKYIPNNRLNVGKNERTDRKKMCL